MNPIKIACIGECMVEFSLHGNNTYQRCFAGDTLNTAIYLQRSLREQPAQVSYVTALGNDPISQDMLDFITQEKINCSLIGTVPDKQPGLYTINLDSNGERSFSYWRNDAAARKLLLGGLTPEQQQQLIDEFDLIYFSGISLAILDPVSRQSLLELLSAARNRGSRIAFDSNYRPALWDSTSTAQTTMNAALEIADIALVTYDDEQMLYGDTCSETTLRRLKQTGITEILVKDGADGCLVDTPDFQGSVMSETVEQVVDTTSAGDSFNAGYLASRLSGNTPEQAAAFAHLLASRVIQHKGAIMPLELCPPLKRIG